MVLKGFSAKEWRRVLGETEEEDAEQILQSLTTLKINQQGECGWDVFIEEILPRLPANRLQKLKIVCKNWERVISSPDFVRLHLNRFNQNRIRVLVPRDSGMMEYNNCDQQIKQIRYPPEIGDIGQRIGERRSEFLGSCDGLLCLRLEGLYRSRTIAMYPSTGKFFRVKLRPKDNYHISCSWFGHRPCSGEYILVLGSCDYEIGVYKFNGRSSLEKIHSTRCFTIRRAFGGIGTLLHGALHWPLYLNWTTTLADHRRAISAYHIENNKYLEISFPSVPVHSDFKLGVVDGCLFAFFCSACVGESKFQLWIMKEYGNPQSWIKYADIHGSISNYNRRLSPLAFFPNGNLNLYPNKLRLIDYVFNDNKVLLLYDDPYTGYEAIVCADSLVSPKIVGT